MTCTKNIPCYNRITGTWIKIDQHDVSFPMAHTLTIMPLSGIKIISFATHLMLIMRLGASCRVMTSRYCVISKMLVLNLVVTVVPHAPSRAHVCEWQWNTDTSSAIQGWWTGIGHCVSQQGHRSWLCTARCLVCRIRALLVVRGNVRCFLQSGDSSGATFLPRIRGRGRDHNGDDAMVAKGW